MTETAFNLVRREDLEPHCPHCNETLTEVYFKSKGAGWFLLPPLSAIFFCPHCRKVLGMGQTRFA